MYANKALVPSAQLISLIYGVGLGSATKITLEWQLAVEGDKLDNWLYDRSLYQMLWINPRGMLL